MQTALVTSATAPGHTLCNTQVKRKVSKELRLAATALAGLLGAPRLSHTQFSYLEVKSIQLDSVAGK